MARADSVKSFEWWMAANLAFGMAFNSFLPVLLPAYVISVGGTPTDVGVAMAMAGLAALAGPLIGRFAAVYGVYRGVLTAGVAGLGAGWAILALSKGDSFLIVAAIAVMGIAAAGILVVAPTYVVGAGLPDAARAKQLTALQLNLDIGKIAGGALLGGLAAAKFSYDAQFWVAALLLAGFAVFVWAASRTATSRLIAATTTPATESSGIRSGTAATLRSMLISLFGLFLLAQLLATMCGVVVSSQYSSIFSSVFALSEAQVASMVSVSGLIGIALYFVAGKWMAGRGPTLVWATGNGLRGLGGLALALLGAAGGAAYLTIVGAYLLFESTAAFSRIAQAATAARFAPAAAAIATGWLAASQALGQAGASLGAGILSEATGSFEVLLWTAAGLGLGSALIGFTALVPRRREVQPAQPVYSPGAGVAG